MSNRVRYAARGWWPLALLLAALVGHDIAMTTATLAESTGATTTGIRASAPLATSRDRGPATAPTRAGVVQRRAMAVVTPAAPLASVCGVARRVTTSRGSNECPRSSGVVSRVQQDSTTVQPVGDGDSPAPPHVARRALLQVFRI